MLRQTIQKSSLKQVPLVPFSEHTEYKVLVDVCDPASGSVLGQREELVTKSVDVPESSHVRHEKADMYSIENLQAVGIPPVVASSRFIDSRLDSLSSFENLSENLLQQINAAEAKKELESKSEPLSVTESDPSNVTKSE